MRMGIDLSTCTERFRKGITWLENTIKFDEYKIKTEIEKKKKRLEELKKSGESEYLIQYSINELEKRLRYKYTLDFAEEMYVLNKVGSKIVSDFFQASENPLFWEDGSDSLMNDIHLLWFMKEIGLGDSSHFLEYVDWLVREQTVTGYIQSNEFDHSGPLRVLVATKPESKARFDATDYWLKNWKKSGAYDTIAVGILALTELDYPRYSNAIQEEISYLTKKQNEDGSWLGYEHGSIDYTSYAVWAISKAKGIEDPSAKKGLKWLIDQQQKDGSWEGTTWTTAPVLLALIAMGEGPKVPLELVNYQIMKLKQSIKKQKPIFVHTSPLYKNTLTFKEIRDKIFDMLHKAQRQIRITSPFIDVLYEEIINVKQGNQDLAIKIITRPKVEVDGLRKRIAKGAIDLLDIATKGNVVQSSLVHSRMVIIDEEELLVSSADLTREQLFDEFNAGIWTCDKETVKKAIDFFENLFEYERKEQKGAQ